MVQSEFKPGLETLRGLAALVVAMSHGRCAFVEFQGALNVTDVVLGIFQPASAVVVFFVLSGYVLGRSLLSDTNYLAFAVRRLLRILPAFIVSVLFAYLVVSWVRIEPAPASTSAFFQSVFWPAPTWSDAYENLLLINSRVNGPTWSIWPELVGSAILPVVVIIHGMAPPKYQWLVFGILAVILAFSPLRLFLYFYVGYFIAPRVSSMIAENPIARSMVLLGGLALLIAFGRDPVDFKFRTIIPSAMGATLLIAAIASTRYRLLEIGPLRFLGRVSYSFYLLHWPVFYLCVMAVLKMAPFLAGAAANLVVMGVSIGATLVFASLSYRLIERPFMRLRSSDLSTTIAPSRAV
jgi:peptidoglycan/LPS O-acetylase OafA/YrhL